MNAPSSGPASADTVKMLQLMGSLACLRNDPRAWRQELLGSINGLLPATASAAFILRGVRAGQSPAIATHFDAGFPSTAHRQAYLREMNAAPFNDPLSRATLGAFTKASDSTLTLLRADVVSDAAWNADLHVLTHRRATGMDDVILSLHRGTEPGIAYALCVFRPMLSRPAEGSASPGKAPSTGRFTPRERLLLDTMHRGLDWLYSAEESAHRVNHASALPPRLRQTLDCLLAGDTERQVALKMSLSIHTVHGYVKSLYSHFGVSSRRELMARWIQIGGSIQPQNEP